MSLLHGYGDIVSKILGHNFDPLGSCDVISHMTIVLTVCGFLLVVDYNRASILHSYGDMTPQMFWGHYTTLTFWSHVTSWVMWPLDSQYVVSCKWSVETTPLSRRVAGILRVKHLATRISIENALITIVGVRGANYGLKYFSVFSHIPASDIRLLSY